MLQRQNNSSQINSRFTPVINLKIWTYVLFRNFTTQKGISKKLQPLRKGPYQINDKPTDVKHKLIDSDKKEIFQYRNNLLPYYPKEYTLRALTQLYSFTGLKVVQDNSDYNQNQNTRTKNIQKPLEENNRNELNQQTSKSLDNKTIPQKERKNRKLEKKILTQDQKKKSQHRQSSQLQKKPRKDCKTFVPQSELFLKVEFQKPHQN